MSTSSMRTTRALVLASGLALTLWGCGGATTGTREPDEYTGCGNDEHWRTFDDQEPLASTSDPTVTAGAPIVTAPAAGATVPFATPVSLQWAQDANDPGSPLGDVPYDNATCNNCCPSLNYGGIQPQHLPPVSGDVYDLHFTVDGKEVWRVITSFQEWVPDPKHDAWPLFKGKTVSVRIYRMNVLRNDVKQGPFVAAQPFTFSVGS